MFFIEKLTNHFYQQENIVMEKRKLSDGTDVLPYIFSWTASSSSFRCVGVWFGCVLNSIPILLSAAYVG